MIVKIASSEHTELKFVTFKYLSKCSTVMKNSHQTQISKEAENKVLNFFSCLADETRLKMLLSIAEKPKSVNDIYEFVGKDKMTLSAISHQLKFMANLGIVSFNKKGKERFFELSDKFCWCVLKDAFNQFDSKIKIKCKKCENHKK